MGFFFKTCIKICQHNSFLITKCGVQIPSYGCGVTVSWVVHGWVFALCLGCKQDLSDWDVFHFFVHVTHGILVDKNLQEAKGLGPD